MSDTLDPIVEQIIASEQLEALEAKTEGTASYVMYENHQGNRNTVELVSMITGEPREVLRIDAPRVMRKRIPGTKDPAFWMEGLPGTPPAYKSGELMCLLHPDHPNREWIDSVGLAGRTCNMMDTTKYNRADFQSTYDMEAHMRRAHQREFSIYNDALARQERAEEKEWRQAQLGLTEGLVEATKQARAPRKTKKDE